MNGLGRSALLFGFTAAIWFIDDASCYVQEHNFTVPIRSRINKITPLFGLDKGGLVKVDMEVAAVGWPRKPPPPWLNIYLVFFNLQQWYEYDLRSFIPSNDYTYACQNDDLECVSLCSLPSVRRFQVWGSPHLTSRKTSVEFETNERTEYTIALLTCAASAHDDTINVEMLVEMLNPGNQHLSVEQIPLQGMYWTLVTAYLLLLVAAVYCLRNGFNGLLLHKLLVGAMCIKLLELVCNLVYYRNLAITGEDVTALFQGTKFGSICADAAFLGMLLLMSLGYTITRESLSRRERQLFWGFFSLYGLFGLLHSVCTSPIYCQGFLLAFYVVKFLITFCIIVAMNANIERLRVGNLDLPRPFTPTQLYLKLLIFHNIRWAFFAVLIFPILLMFVEVAVLSWEQSWVGPLLQELLYLCVFLLIAHTLRLHKPPPDADAAEEEPLTGAGGAAEE
eukprot:CAMPEP_0181303940 /NCGR_PEP_ID=MMETSP1101-20121128/8854_1 /TAXON_ID=46948 /ORGANISM="Rhodomonas abbreviata, Strain Caron Lab Isolate" /LENGTH=448 /DNA_ID=CAMNT_0023409603 /DNA_START=202 /DNA_END=1545 /DNA_ORIENTATION=-